MDGTRLRVDEPTRPRRSQPVWIRLPIAEAKLLTGRGAMPRYCEALRCQSKRRSATTFHAVIDVRGEADYAWVACADCTGLMLEGAYER